MVFSVVEKTFVGYGFVIVAGALAFIGARFKVYNNRDEILAARERIYRAVTESSDFEQVYPHYTEEARKKFQQDSESKPIASSQ